MSKPPRNTKIVATLGPASCDPNVVQSLAETGVNVFRLNMSHGDHSTIAAMHKAVRDAERVLGRPIGILADLQGPKIRCGEFSEGPYLLRPGQEFTFDTESQLGSAERVQLPHPEVISALREGSAILVNDGKIKMRVEKAHEEHVLCKVEIGGEISNRKGVNLPDVMLPLSALSSKDRADLEFVSDLGVDWLALSFVQRAEDVAEAQALLKGRAKIVAKIEKPAAVENYSQILRQADGIMVARGDLGVEMPVQEVPRIQKSLLAQAKAAGKPVIVATQMLESMIEAPVPTRAEVSDVATAIYDGTDAVMLSAETAAGKFPLEAVRVMVAVAHETENDPRYAALMKERSDDLDDLDTSHAIAAAAREISDRARVSAICCFTQSGTTAFLVAREKPAKPIVAMTPNVQTARLLTLVWGLRSVVVPQAEHFRDAVQSASEQCKQLSLAQPDDEVVVTAGVPIGQAGTTNILRVTRI